MPRQDRVQTWDQQGNLISDVTVQVPVRSINDAELNQAKQTLKNMVQTFYPGGVPTGTPTGAQTRNWLLALTAAVRYLYNATDDKEE